jgi:hypothetical protein
MCSRYTYTKDEAKLRLRDKIIRPGRILKITALKPREFQPKK